MLSLEDVRAAAARIAGKVRRTPLIAAEPAKRALGDGPVSYKLECLQVTGSFKARGAISKLGTLSANDIAKGLVTASGGNHGLAIAYAGWLTGRPATIFVPENVSPAKAVKIKEWGAELIVTGKVWDESNRAAMAHVARTGATYIHPFADLAIMAGQGTIALELFEDDETIDTLIVAIGGGGLIAGIATAAKALNPSMRIIGASSSFPRSPRPCRRWRRARPRRSTSTSSAVTSRKSCWSATRRCTRRRNICGSRAVSRSISPAPPRSPRCSPAACARRLAAGLARWSAAPGRTASCERLQQHRASFETRSASAPQDEVDR